MSKNNIEGEKVNQLPILSSIREGEQMDEQELNFSGNEDDDDNEDHLGVGLDDNLASGRCSSTLPPPIAERSSIRAGSVNNSANLTAALHAVNNHHSAITTGPAWSNRPPLSVDTQKPATEVFYFNYEFAVALFIKRQYQAILMCWCNFDSFFCS